MVTTQTTTDIALPAKTFRCGRIQAAVWLNESAPSRETGVTRVRHNVTVSRSFKRNPTAEWEQTHSFSREEALVAARLLQRAHDWINDELSSSSEQDS